MQCQHQLDDRFEIITEYMPSIQEQWLSRINLTLVLFPQFGFLEISEVKLSSQVRSEPLSLVSVGRVLIVLLVAEVLCPNLRNDN